MLTSSAHSLHSHMVCVFFSTLQLCVSTRILKKCVRCFPITCLNNESSSFSSFSEEGFCSLWSNIHLCCPALTLQRACLPHLNEAWPFSLNLDWAVYDCGVSVCFIKEPCSLLLHYRSLFLNPIKMYYIRNTFMFHTDFSKKDFFLLYVHGIFFTFLPWIQINQSCSQSFVLQWRF